MERWAFFGPEDELTPITRLIMAEDIAGLDATLGREWGLDQPSYSNGAAYVDLTIGPSALIVIVGELICIPTADWHLLSSS